MVSFLCFLVAVVAIIVMIALIRTNSMSLRIKALEAELKNLRGALNALWQKTYASSLEKAIPPAETPVASEIIEQPATPPPSMPEVPMPEPVPAAQPTRSSEEWEALVGGKLLNRIGAVAIIFGVGFFLKYAFDNNLISETVRVLIGGVCGLTLLAVAMKARKKGLDIFAQGLVGAGLAILYLSDYAAYNFYSLISLPVAFVLMSVVTIIAFQQALTTNSLAVSLLGWAGGFLTPFLLHSNQASEAGLFGYIAVLDIGLLAIVLKKNAWAVIETLTLAATYIVYWVWREEFGTGAPFLLTLLFLTFFWLLFHILDVFRSRRGENDFAALRQSTALANVLFYFFSLSDLIHKSYPDWTSGVTLALGVFYFATFLSTRGEQANPSASLRYLLTAIALLVIATGIEYSGFTLVMLWSAEAFVLVWSGVHWKVTPVWCVALGLFALAVFALFTLPATFAYVPLNDFTLLWNKRAATLLSLSLISVLCALIFRRADVAKSRMIQAFLHSGWCALIFLLLTVETRDAFEATIAKTMNLQDVLTSVRNLEQLTLSGVWLLYSMILMTFGLWRRQRGLRIFSIILFGITILKAFFFDLSFLDTLYRIISFIGLGLILVGVSYLYQRYKSVIFDLKPEP